MKKISKFFLIFSLSVLFLLLPGCKKAQDIGNQVIDDTKKSYDNAAAEVKKVSDTTVQKVNDIEDAAKKIQDASDAIQKVTSTDNKK